MAAGRFDVDGYRRRETDNYARRNGYGHRCGVESNRRVHDHSDLFRDGSNGPAKECDLDSRPAAEGCGRKEEVKSGEAWKRQGSDNVQSQPQKKRKFSPIVWDVEEKGVSCSSKNSVVTSNSQQISPSEYVAKPLQLEDLDVSSVKLAGSGMPKSPVNVSPLLPVEEYESSVCKGKRLEEEFRLVRGVESSRWASDSSSPSDILLSGGEETPNESNKRSSGSSRTVGDIRSSTPESGEICRDLTGGDCGSLSVEGDHSLLTHRDNNSCKADLENDDIMSIIDKTCDSPGVGQAQSEDEEPAVSSNAGFDMLQGSRSVYEYERLNKINEGSYGIVYRARNKKTDKLCALKKVKMYMGRQYLEYGFPLSALREINILLSLNHPSLVDVKEVVTGNDDSVYMVMEYMEHDLKGLLEKMKQNKPQRFNTSEVKCLMKQLLEGVSYLHSNWVMHRDLKTSNILFNNKGQLKICDFGISRQYGSPTKPYTPVVVTLHYRAPELLLEAKHYSTAIDMWSVGCIMAELLTNETLFNGKTEADQLKKIFEVLGAPEKTWPSVSALPGAKKAIFAGARKPSHTYQTGNLLRAKFPVASFTGSAVLSDNGFDLLNKLLSYDPEKRITADAALSHEWFREVPLPKDREFMPTFPPQHAQR